MQNGGCTAADHCVGSTVPRRDLPVPRRERRTARRRARRSFPPYEIRKIDRREDRVHRPDPRGDARRSSRRPGSPASSSATRSTTANALVEKLATSRACATFVVLLHQGGFQNPPAPGRSGPEPRRLHGRQQCVSVSGPEIIEIADRPRPAGRRRRHAPHARAVHLRRSDGQARDERLVVRPRRHRHRPRDRPRRRRTSSRSTADNVIVTQDVAKDPALTRDRRSLPDRVGADREPDRRRDHADITSASAGRSGADRRVRARRRDRRRAARGDAADGLRRRPPIAFMNPGGIRGELLYARSPGGEAAGQVTYGELFDVQPFGNSLVVKTCTGAQIKRACSSSSSRRRRRRPLGSCRSRTASRTRTTRDAARRDPGRACLDQARTGRDRSRRRRTGSTMNSFLATGGDGFTVFKECTNAARRRDRPRRARPVLPAVRDVVRRSTGPRPAEPHHELG